MWAKRRVADTEGRRGQVGRSTRSPGQKRADGETMVGRTHANRKRRSGKGGARSPLMDVTGETDGAREKWQRPHG